MEQQILTQVIQIVSGPGGLASFLRRNLLGKPLAGPSLPLDVGQTNEIPLHPATWPWADAIATAWARVTALPHAP